MKNIEEIINKINNNIRLANYNLSKLDWNYERIAELGEDIKDIKGILSELVESAKILDNCLETTNGWGSRVEKMNINDAAKIMFGTVLEYIPFGRIYINEYYELIKHSSFAYAVWENYRRDALNIVREHSEDLTDYDIYKFALKFIETLSQCYKAFYHDFYMSEQGIEVLCGIYNDDIFKSENKDIKLDDIRRVKEEYVQALFLCVSLAGDFDDYGYAYNGISMIKKYINLLPKELVTDELIRLYTVDNILLKEIVRKQLYTLITTIFGEEDKKKTSYYKFFYLDSFVIFETIANYVKKIDLDLKEETNFYYIEKMEEKIGRYGALQLENKLPSDISDGHEIGINFNDRELKVILSLGEDDNIYISEGERRLKIAEFSLEDYKLDCFKNFDFAQKISVFFGKEIVDERLLFSLVYIENYRGINKQCLNFDHKYQFDLSSGELSLKDNETIQGFYGKNVYSTTCIVGRNGVGKTSIIEFLKEYFFEILAEHSIDNVVGKYLIVFCLNNEYYYVTNCINDISFKNIDIKEYFEVNSYASFDNLTRAFYFSEQIRPYRVVNHEMYSAGFNSYSRHMIERRKLVENMSEEFYLLERLRTSKRYSSSDSIRKNLDKRCINHDLLYQWMFLKCADKDLLQRLEINLSKEYYFIIDSWDDISQIKFTIEDIRDNNEKVYNQFIEYLTKEDVFLGHFSSGEYARFAYLARLFFLLNGTNETYKSAIDEIRTKFEKLETPKQIEENENIIIMIDEGEVYYHPEWQRSYMKILLDLINSNGVNANVQLIITTNSPFILSDILAEDVFYLGNNDCINKIDCTFGQNIHTLLCDHFFMDYTIGEYSKEIINKIYNLMKAAYDDERKMSSIEIDVLETYVDTFFKGNDNNSLKEKLELIVGKIGEIFYRRKLQEMIEVVFDRGSRRDDVQELKARIQILEQENQQLKSEIGIRE